MSVLTIENDSKEKVDKNGVKESEKKRLQSLKAKKEAFRAKERAIQDALKNLDDKPRNNKIIFDEDIDVDKVKEPKVKKKKRKKDLFDDDENESELTWKAADFEFKEKKVPRNAFVPGNDERFKLDDRFVEEEDASVENNVGETHEEDDLQKEKEWQLDILGSVLGVPVLPKTKDAQKSTSKGMIRYDPTQNDHKEYEIPTEKPEPLVKKPKKKRKLENAEEPVPVEVSKEIYFSVSDSLTKSLKEEGQFSLLKTHGRDYVDEKSEKEYSTTAIESNKKFQFNFDSKNPFKYDSSDDENDGKQGSEEKSAKAEDTQEERSNNLYGKTDSLFFEVNDARFEEATKFFSKVSVPYEEFKNLRQELKQIVRAKIRKNVKKSQPYGNKRVPKPKRS